MNYIDNYLNDVLTKQLKQFEMSDAICVQVTENIKLQMLSLLQYWDNEEFRNTILTIGLEEGTFYKPNAKIEVKCFVVVTIRDSLIETLASDDYNSLSAQRAISDYEIKEITATAIEYFSAIDFASVSKSLEYSNIDNIYKKLKDRYPVAWGAISSIGNTKKKCLRYEKIGADFENELMYIINQQENTLETVFNKVVLSGYDENFDEDLIKILKYAYSTPNFVFFANSFKMISRNISKLFRVLNFLLQCKVIIVTANYYITNGHVEIRSPVIKPAHTISEADKNLFNAKGLSSKHSGALKEILKQL